MGKDVISFQCSCGKNYIVGAQHAGKKVQCKQCGAKLYVPSSSHTTAATWTERIKNSPWSAPPVAKPAPPEETKSIPIEETHDDPAPAPAAHEPDAPDADIPDPPGFTQREARALLTEYLDAWRAGHARDFAKARVVNINAAHAPTACRVESIDYDPIMRRWRIAVRCTFDTHFGVAKSSLLNFDVAKDPDGSLRLSTFDSAA